MRPIRGGKLSRRELLFGGLRDGVQMAGQKGEKIGGIEGPTERGELAQALIFHIMRAAPTSDRPTSPK